MRRRLREVGKWGGWGARVGRLEAGTAGRPDNWDTLVYQDIVVVVMIGGCGWHD